MATVSSPSAGGAIYTCGAPANVSFTVPAGQRLQGAVTAELINQNQTRQVVQQIGVNVTGPYTAQSPYVVTVTFPPASTWPVTNPNNVPPLREAHVDIAVEVYDVATGALLQTLGPGHQFDVGCTQTFTATPTATATPTNTPTPTATSVPMATVISPSAGGAIYTCGAPAEVTFTVPAGQRLLGQVTASLINQDQTRQIVQQIHVDVTGPYMAQSPYVVTVTFPPASTWPVTSPNNVPPLREAHVDIAVEVYDVATGALLQTLGPGHQFDVGCLEVFPTSTPTPTNTPAQAATNTPTATPTNTPAPTSTPTNTPAPTSTPTNTPTAVPTDTPTTVPAPTNTPTPVPQTTNQGGGGGSSPTDTPTPTPTPTNTPTAAPTTTSGGTVQGNSTTSPAVEVVGEQASSPATSTPTAAPTNTPTAPAPQTAVLGESAAAAPATGPLAATGPSAIASPTSRPTAVVLGIQAQRAPTATTSNQTLAQTRGTLPSTGGPAAGALAVFLAAVGVAGIVLRRAARD